MRKNPIRAIHTLFSARAQRGGVKDPTRGPLRLEIPTALKVADLKKKYDLGCKRHET